MHASDLAAYHPQALLAALSTDAPVTSLMRLRRARADDAIEARGVEELIDLPERNEMTHVGCLRAEPFCLLLAAVLRRGQHALALERGAGVRLPWP